VKFLKNNKGVALVTALMLTMLTFTITMVMLYIILQSTRLSGSQRRYHNALDAAVGGVEVVTVEALPKLLAYALYPEAGSDLQASLSAAMPGLNQDNQLTVPSDNCLKTKLTTNTIDWTNCGTASKTIDARQQPDMFFTLKSTIPAGKDGATNAPGYRVFVKIVSTTRGSSDTSGRDLDGSATYEAPASDVGSPYLYRMEVSSDRANNPLEKANLSVLYAY